MGPHDKDRNLCRSILGSTLNPKHMIRITVHVDLFGGIKALLRDTTLRRG